MSVSHIRIPNHTIVKIDATGGNQAAKDNIPVEADAVVFYRVNNVKEAMLKVEDYHEATKLRSRSALRDIVGKSTLDQLMSKRDEIGKLLQKNLNGLLVLVISLFFTHIFIKISASKHCIRSCL